jgi:Flp pilus assembly protein TadD
VSRHRQIGIVLILIISGLVFAAYSSTLNSGFVYDDVPLIIENPLIRNLTNLPRMFTLGLWELSSLRGKSYYRPLLTLSLAVNYALGGFDPFGYHLFNVLVHTANALLVFTLAYLVSRQIVTSAVVGLLFGLHPINSEVVAWSAARVDSIPTFFLLGALVLYIGGFPPDDFSGPEVRTNWLMLSLSLLAFLLGLFSKESAVTLVVVLTVYEMAFRPAVPKKGFRLLPFVAVLAVYLGWWLLKFGDIGENLITFLLNPLVKESILVRFMTGVKLFGKSLWLYFFPFRLAPDYSFNSIPVVRTPSEAGVVFCGLVVLCLVGLWLYCWRRNPLVFFGLGFFFATWVLIFVNALLPVAPILAERFLYLPSVGFVLACVGLVHWGIECLPERPQLVTSVVLATVVLSCFFVRTWYRNLDWHDNLSLFQSAVEVSPNSALIRNNLADLYFREGKHDLARFHYLRALDIYPTYSRAHIGFGNLALFDKDFQKAGNHYFRAMVLEPNFSQSYLGLALAYQGLGKLDKARKMLEKGLLVNPNNYRIYNVLAHILRKQGDVPRALALWHKSVALNPLNAHALFNLASSYDQLGQKDKARIYYQQFLAKAPDSLKGLKDQAREKLSDMTHQ